MSAVHCIRLKSNGEPWTGSAKRSSDCSQGWRTMIRNRTKRRPAALENGSASLMNLNHRRTVREHQSQLPLPRWLAHPGPLRTAATLKINQPRQRVGNLPPRNRPEKQPIPAPSTLEIRPMIAVETVNSCLMYSSKRANKKRLTEETPSQPNSVSGEGSGEHLDLEA